MTDKDLEKACKAVVAAPLLAHTMTDEVAQAVLDLIKRYDHWRNMQYRRVALAWHEVEGNWICRLGDPIQCWYSVHPHAHRFWVYGGFDALSEGQTFCQHHADAMYRGVDDLIGVVSDEVII